MKKRLLRALAILAGLLAACAIVEQLCEWREEQRVGADQTWAQVDGARVRYSLLGADKQGAPVVFINGMAASLEQWSELQPEVAKFSPALAYDRGGSGLSHGSRARDGDSQAEELIGLLDALHISKPVVLVGYSTSGPVARITAARHRDRVAGMVLLEPRISELTTGVAGYQGMLRMYARPLVRETLSSLFGLTRLRQWLLEPPPRTPVEARARAVLSRFAHWWAVDVERVRAYEIDAQARAAGPAGPTPVIVLLNDYGGDPQNLWIVALEKFARSSTHGQYRVLPKEKDHAHILDSRKVQAAMIAAIRELASPAP